MCASLSSLEFRRGNGDLFGVWGFGFGGLGVEGLDFRSVGFRVRRFGFSAWRGFKASDAGAPGNNRTPSSEDLDSLYGHCCDCCYHYHNRYRFCLITNTVIVNVFAIIFLSITLRTLE